ncbi:hypothetical protein [Roseiflexus sp.]
MRHCDALRCPLSPRGSRGGSFRRGAAARPFPNRRATWGRSGAAPLRRRVPFGRSSAAPLRRRAPPSPPGFSLPVWAQRRAHSPTVAPLGGAAARPFPNRRATWGRSGAPIPQPSRRLGAQRRAHSSTVAPPGGAAALRPDVLQWNHV